MTHQRLHLDDAGTQRAALWLIACGRRRPAISATNHPALDDQPLHGPEETSD